MRTQRKRKHLSLNVKALICLALLIAFFSAFAVPMGLGNALNTLMNTAYRLLIDTVFYIMAIAVIAGAISGLLTEFGVVALLNRLLSPLMRPLFGMPGASSLGMVSTYLSDNPAILTLADDKKFRRFFRAYQIPALTNLGTAFGMGLIVTSFTLGMSNLLGGEVWMAALCGNLGAIVGAIVSTRIMLFFMRRCYDPAKPALEEDYNEEEEAQEYRHKGVLHVLDALMDGGKKGVAMGLTIIPGVLIICSIVLMLTNGRPASKYTGVMVQKLTADGSQVLASTDSISFPEEGNYLLDFSENSKVALWTLYGENGAETTSETAESGRSFSGGEQLYVRMTEDVWGPAEDCTFHLLLVREDESVTVLELTEDGADGVYSASVPEEHYDGGAYEGIGLLPRLADRLSFLLRPMFGFSSGEAIAVPVTALGSAGAALGLIPGFAKHGLVTVNDLAVFTAICMCWSGFLSTHVSMMEVLGCREHTGKALISHTVGGLAAGVAAHWLLRLLSLLL